MPKKVNLLCGLSLEPEFVFLLTPGPPSCVSGGSVGKDDARGQLDCALQDVNVRYAVLEETEKRAVCRALIEERARYCSFVSMLKPVLVSVCDDNLNPPGLLEELTTHAVFVGS